MMMMEKSLLMPNGFSLFHFSICIVIYFSRYRQKNVAKTRTQQTALFHMLRNVEKESEKRGSFS